MLARAWAVPVLFLGLIVLDGCAANGNMATKTMDNPYDVTVLVWLDEQPGGKPRLHVSAIFDPRPGGSAWKQVRLSALELQQGRQSWNPGVTAMEPRGAGFEVKAEGEPPAGMKGPLTLVASFEAADGPKRVSVPVPRFEVVQ